MTLLVPFFFAHQPSRLRPAEARHASSADGAGNLGAGYFDGELNRRLFHEAAELCYRPATHLIRDLVKRQSDRERPFRVAYGLSGTLLEQAIRDAPDLLDLWKELADTGHVEFTGETYYHSLSSLFDETRTEFQEQVELHRAAIQTHFGQTPTVFRNTGMLYNDAIAATIQGMGFQGMMTEGVDWLMAGWRSPDFVYQSPSGLPILLRNYRLSDDIGYRFSDRSWAGYPLTAEKYSKWLAGNPHPLVLLAMDYETLGGHVSAKTGIFDFLADLPEQTARHAGLEWATPSQALAAIPVSGQIGVPVYSTISWADQERDTSAWLGNGMQQFCYDELKRMEPLIRATGSQEYLTAWRRLQASDNLRCLSDKATLDNRIRKALPECSATPVDGFQRLHGAVYDLKRRAEKSL